MANIFIKEDKDVAHYESGRNQMVMPIESFLLHIKANAWGLLEQRLDDSNYESWTQLSKRKDARKDDMSIDTTIDNVTTMNIYK